jgi:hypothetical protein
MKYASEKLELFIKSTVLGFLSLVGQNREDMLNRGWMPTEGK